jgi:murein DD-endopeptidase MepM/ murein hydrolase activator NlpD
MKHVFWISLALALGAYLLGPLPGRSEPLPQRIEKKRVQVERAKRSEGVLTRDLAGYETRIESLDGRLRSTGRRLVRVQSALDRERARLLAVRQRLEVARDRLARAGARLRRARGDLRARLVELYKADTPDLLTVVLEADGFTDLLERTDFLDRIAEHDRQVFGRVRALTRATERQADQLASLEKARKLAAVRILRNREDLAANRDQLSRGRTELVSVRARRGRARARIRNSRQRAQEDLVALQRASARVQRRLQAAAAARVATRAPAGPGPAPAPAAGPVRRGSGRLIWPVNGTVTSPFGPRDGRLHAGLDIAAPGGTPIRAADSGRVVLAGSEGGYGLYTCVQHSGSLSTCYAHQSRLGTSSGASVRQGQVIGYVGNTGNSFGNHLHFETRINGNPVNPLGIL